ncbi:MAG: type II toxin-antitoxin system VapC family toxin [Planctomycetes bacterium]|nr:type II toxin-antitoxin system VapC family toxin [Planctomycetota bacterium]
MGDLVYLDYNCFQRGFDDHRQVRIRMEAAACEEVFAKAEEGVVRLVWSFMHEDECALCPFPERALEALNLACVCAVRVGPTEEVRTAARSIQQEANLSARDAVHLACARAAGANVLLTCDDDFLRRAPKAAAGIAVMNPVDYVRSKQGGW